MRRRFLLPILQSALAGLAASAVWAEPSAGRAMELDERTACMAVIEDLRWSNRIWPEHNAQPKPKREDMLPDAAIRERARTALKQEALLASRYGIRLDSRALQVELNRMAHETRAPAELDRLFTALDRDPLRIAECLVRPHLAQARLREAYTWDAALHAPQRRAAEEALLAGDVIAAATATGARLSAALYVREDEESEAASTASGRDRVEHLQPGRIGLRSEAFEQQRQRLQADLGAGAKQAMRWSSPRETRDGFELQQLLDSEADTLSVRTLTWPKRSFEEWWHELAATAPEPHFPPTPANLQLPAIAVAGTAHAKAAADSWRIESFPEPRRHATAVWTGSEMIIWGGNTVGLDVSTGSRYDPLTDSWTPTSMDGAPNPSAAHQAVWTGSEMLVWGMGAQGVGYTAGRYHPASDTWAPMSLDGAPAPRQYHSAVWTGVELLVWGGSGNGWPPYNSGGRYDPETDSWLPTSQTGAPSPRNRHTTVWTGTELIVWGGCGEPCPLDDGGRYDPASDSWIPLPALGAPSARYEHAAVWSGTEMILWGGCCMPVDGGRFNPASNEWAGLSTDGAPSPRYRHTAIWTGEAMLVWGGYWTPYPNSVGIYDPAADAWTDVAGNGAPPGRELHAAIWTGSEMIVWGGGDETGRTDLPGGRFSPASGQWIPVAHSQAPSARHAHTAVWSGNELLIWGGMTQTGATFAEGARYEPATDHWSIITATDAPAPRYENRAAWTGTEMIVWGGLATDFYTTFNTGGRYNPTLESWSGMSTVDAPQARYRHGMDWSGTELIVWGGWWNGSYEPVGSGARYDPVSDTWLPTSLDGAPSPRGWHASAWTGSELLVWGGAGADLNRLGDGARYDPASDSWQVMNASGAPTPRFAPSSIWTGSELMIWGGSSEGEPPSDGSRYDPVSDAWSPLPPAPEGIAQLSESPLLWTGSEMIAWGGMDRNWFLIGGREGGRYDPTSDTWLSTSLDFAPERRFRHTINWTGSSMLVWGGCCSLASLGVYYPYPVGEPSTTTLVQLAPNPLRWGDLSHAEVAVSGSSLAPIDGRVRVAASSGESCSAHAADAVDGAVASYSCSLAFKGLGPRSIAAGFSHSSSHLDSSAAPVQLSVMRFADLWVTAVAPDEPAAIGESLELGLQFINEGPDEAPGTRLQASTSPALDALGWTCVATGTAICPAASGAGSIDIEWTLPAESSLDFQLTGTVPETLGDAFTFNVSAQAAAGAPHYVHDPQPGDNALVMPLQTQLIFRNGFE